MDELVDVVNENDKVISQKSILGCHANRILHRAVNILVFRDVSLQDILIQERSMQKFVLPGKFEFTGGHLEMGETYLDGAKRELQEELFHNQKLPDMKFERLFKIKKDADADYEFMTVYSVIYSSKFNLNPDEVADYRFENIGNLMGKIKSNPDEYTGTCRLMLEEYFKRYLYIDKDSIIL